MGRDDPGAPLPGKGGVPGGHARRLVRVEKDGHRPVVDRGHLHIRPELAVLHRKTPLAALLHKPLIQRDSQVGLGGVGEAGAAGGGVGVQGELRHHQQRASHLLQV